MNKIIFLSHSILGKNFDLGIDSKGFSFSEKDQLEGIHEDWAAACPLLNESWKSRTRIHLCNFGNSTLREIGVKLSQGDMMLKG